MGYVRFCAGFFITSIIPLNKLFYNNIILFASLKKINIYIIFTILLMLLKKINIIFLGKDKYDLLSLL